MSTTTHRPPTTTDRSRLGQGWALAACLVLVGLAFLGPTLSFIITEIMLPSRVGAMMSVMLWCYVMTGPVTLLGLAAASLRRIALSIVAIVVGLAHGAALLVLLLLNVTDISVTAAVLSAGTLGLAMLTVGLSTIGAALALFLPSRRWPATAVVGLVIAAVGSVPANVQELIAGPLLRGNGAPSSFSPLAFVAPASIVLLGLAVASRKWPLAGVAGVALLIGTVVVVVGLAGGLEFYLGHDRGALLVIPGVVEVVRMLLAAGAATGLTIRLLRSSG